MDSALQLAVASELEALEHERPQALLYASVLSDRIRPPGIEYKCFTCDEPVSWDEPLTVAFVQRLIRSEFDQDRPAGVEALLTACSAHAVEVRTLIADRAGNLAQAIESAQADAEPVVPGVTATYAAEFFDWQVQEAGEA
jgi:hypothetical protein